MSKPYRDQPAPEVNADSSAAPAPLSMGQQVRVMVAPGVELLNNEIGVTFAADVATLQTVSVTLLRRLADGDLTLAAD